MRCPYCFGATDSANKCWSANCSSNIWGGAKAMRADPGGRLDKTDRELLIDLITEVRELQRRVDSIRERLPDTSGDPDFWPPLT